MRWRIRSGATAAARRAIVPPSEYPTTAAGPLTAPRNMIKSSLSCDKVPAAWPAVVLPWPRRSTAKVVKEPRWAATASHERWSSASPWSNTTGLPEPRRL